MSREVVVVSGVRTAIGTFGGSLKDFSPTKMGALVVAEALKRNSTLQSLELKGAGRGRGGVLLGRWGK